MKRTISFVLVLMVMLSFTGCVPSETPETTSKEATEIRATVTTNSGETKQMTLQELRKIEETNGILFESEYIGANITVTSTIKKIGGAYEFPSWFECDAYVELEANNIGTFFKPITEEYAKTLNVGDTITVSGKIAMASAAGFEIYIFKDKISPY